MIKQKLYPFIGLGTLLLIWQLASMYGAFGPEFSEAFSPRLALAEAYHLLCLSDSYNQIGRSLTRVGLGLAIAFAAGVPAGIMAGYFKTIDRFTSVCVQFLRMISPLSWMPVAIIFLGVGDGSVIFLVAVAAVWPIMINTAHGVSEVPAEWYKIAKNFGATNFEILRKVALPASIPQVLTGLRVALGVAWIVLVPAEMLGVTSGLGYMILDTRDRFAFSELIAWILIIGFIGFLLDTLLRFLKKRSIHEYQS